MSDIEKLTAKVESLSLVVEKQSKLIAQTGQKLIELQIQDVKTKINNYEPTKNLDLDDYVTNDDIVQLVGELQGQLDALEDRSIKRSFNAQLDAANPENAMIAPLTNRDGELAPESIKYPSTLQEFINLDKTTIVNLSVFYELIVQDQEQQNIQQLLDGKDENVIQDSIKVLEGPQFLQNAGANFSEEEVDDIYDELARYLGIKYRKNKKNW